MRNPAPQHSPVGLPEGPRSSRSLRSPGSRAIEVSREPAQSSYKSGLLVPSYSPPAPTRSPPLWLRSLAMSALATCGGRLVCVCVVPVLTDPAAFFVPPASHSSTERRPIGSSPPPPGSTVGSHIAATLPWREPLLSRAPLPASLLVEAWLRRPRAGRSVGCLWVTSKRRPGTRLPVGRPGQNTSSSFLFFTSRGSRGSQDSSPAKSIRRHRCETAEHATALVGSASASERGGSLSGSPVPPRRNQKDPWKPRDPRRGFFSGTPYYTFEARSICITVVKSGSW